MVIDIFIRCPSSRNMRFVRRERTKFLLGSVSHVTTTIAHTELRSPATNAVYI